MMKEYKTLSHRKRIGGMGQAKLSVYYRRNNHIIHYFDLF